MGLFLLLVFAFLLPTSLYGIYHLGLKRRGTSGADELLFLVYALEVAFTTLVSIFDSFYWDSAVYSAELKRTFLVQLYGPWCLVHECRPGVLLGRCLTANKQPSAPSTWRPGSSLASRRPTPLWMPGSRSSAFSSSAAEGGKEDAAHQSDGEGFLPISFRGDVVNARALPDQLRSAVCVVSSYSSKMVRFLRVISPSPSSGIPSRCPRRSIHTRSVWRRQGAFP